MADYQYQVGGSLTLESPTYVWRQADEDLYRGLKAGEYCYVLNSRQMGKSSLRVRTMQRLQAEGVACAAIDLTRIGSQQVSLEQWYAGIVRNLWSSFNLTKKVNLRSWWREQDYLSSVQRLSEFIEDVILEEVSQNIVIFIDEIDSVLSLGFNVDDFFKLIRFCFNERASNRTYSRLSFALLGVASPADLVALLGTNSAENSTPTRNLGTPFNIGVPIELTGFHWRNMRPLCWGIERQARQPEVLLSEVYKWTRGQPFLTQKICKIVQTYEQQIAAGEESRVIENIVRSQIVENWGSQDEPEHLRTIRDRLLLGKYKDKLLHLYQKILRHGAIEFENTPEQLELRLTGLVVHSNGKLKVFNRVYAAVFDQAWLNPILEAEKATKPAPIEIVSLSLQLDGDLPISECGLDYIRLQQLLATQQWRDADLETRDLMLQAVNRHGAGDFRPEDFQHFPRTDLRTIDRLWNQASKGRFGFGIQARIWQEVRDRGGSDFQIKDRFGDRLEWRSRRFWKPYPSLNFTLDAPEGHLPMAWTGYSGNDSRVTELKIFFDRFATCDRDAANSSNPEADLLLPQKIDYTRLRYLLTAGQWQSANLETQRILLKIVDRVAENSWRLEDVGNLTDGDLHVLDRLWTQYSDGRFGFSIQQQIWQNLAIIRSTSQRIEQFIQLVGWRDSRHWKSWDCLTFSLKSPAGHLPSFVAPPAGGVSQSLLLSYFLGRWEECQKQQRNAATTLDRLPDFAGGIHCTPLKHFLLGQQWQAAEKETVEQILKIAGCPTPGQLSVEAIERLPCEALLGLDRLWVSATQSQSWIWLSFRNQPRHIWGKLLPALFAKLTNCYASDK
ncbi:MAG TPA: GUN4 domain-containing protein [Oscillatoriales cyanobacterium M59_W2019_021]|nr:MAG: hypothetical protein D6728_14865 [Cyanobacteria bacterium J055]HIK30764.1 GUN4 domain-containing protein [Oscillatoriales cyanobacterium M4454_W2019_049]HIK51949.1 GUN4 domain-containing protein [Oscillatoriales cyanobacterium M59_W2019_021]